MIRNEEQEHADEIAERIVQIGGEPDDCRYCLTAPSLQMRIANRELYGGGDMELYCAVALRGALPINQLQRLRRSSPASRPSVRLIRRCREVPTFFCNEVALRVRRGRMVAAVSGASSPVTRAQPCG